MQMVYCHVIWRIATVAMARLPKSLPLHGRKLATPKNSRCFIAKRTYRKKRGLQHFILSGGELRNVLTHPYRPTLASNMNAPIVNFWLVWTPNDLWLIWTRLFRIMTVFWLQPSYLTVPCPTNPGMRMIEARQKRWKHEKYGGLKCRGYQCKGLRLWIPQKNLEI